MFSLRRVTYSMESVRGATRRTFGLWPIAFMR